MEFAQKTQGLELGGQILYDQGKGFSCGLILE